MKKRVTVLLLLAVFAALTGCRGMSQAEAPTPEYIFTYAENQAEDYPTAQGAYRFSELVYERTGGRIKINVYPVVQLGDEPAVLEQLRFGGIDFARVSIMAIADSIPQMNVLQLPYLYESGAHMWRVLDGEIGDRFMGFLDGSGYVGLSWYDAGARHFYNAVKPITCLEDLAGMKMRVAESALMSSMVYALGAMPYTVTYSEVYSALETGVISGAENNWPSYQSARHYEVAKYITTDAHNRIPELQVCAQSTWDQLPQADRETILDCARESAVYERELWAQREQEAQEALENAGCVVTQLSPEEQHRFRQAVAPLYEEFCADYQDLVQAIQNEGEQG